MGQSHYGDYYDDDEKARARRIQRDSAFLGWSVLVVCVILVAIIIFLAKQ